MAEAKRILIVEDETITAMAIEDYLTEKGFRVIGSSATGEDAIRIADAGNPDLVFMDYVLAGPMNGLETAERINAARRVPVAMMSGYAKPVVFQGASGYQPDAYLSKPIDFDLFGEVLRAILGSESGR